jgi:hypothetical protein
MNLYLPCLRSIALPAHPAIPDTDAKAIGYNDSASDPEDTCSYVA